MSNTFDLIGKFSVAKETENFKPYKIETFPSGWISNKLLFTVVAGDNRHFLESKGMAEKDGKGKVYTTAKSGKDDNGNKIKGENIQIEWKDRFNPEVIENVAEFKKFVVDLEEYGRRFKLEKALEKSKEGTLSEAELTELGVTNIELAFEESKKKRREFIAESDFAEYLHKLVTSNKIEGKLFRVSGNFVYSEYKGKFYKKLAPTRIYLAEKEAVPSSTGQITLFFNKDCIDSSLVSKNKKKYIDGYVKDYDNNRKSSIFCPIKLVLDLSKDESNEANKKLNTFFEKQFTVKDKTWKELGVKVKILEGSQKVEITDSMLTDIQKELLELGAITLDDIRKEIGGDVYGDKIDEMVIVNVARGYTKGRKDTLYKAEDFIIPEIKIKDKPQNNESAEDSEDIFDDIDI